MIRKILFIGSLVLSLAEGCPSGGSGGGGPKACDIRVNVHPHLVPNPGGKGHGRIEAAIKAWCDKPPAEHTVIVRLEVEASDGKTWKPVGPEERDSVVPNSAGRVTRVSTDCVDGIWRVYARVEGRGPNSKDKPFKFYLPEEERLARSIKCPVVKLPLNLRSSPANVPADVF